MRQPERPADREIRRNYRAGVDGQIACDAEDGTDSAAVRPNSVWLTKELPALRANPGVTSIAVVDPKTMAEKIIFSR